MSDILIRKATESDLPAIVKLLKELIEVIDNTENVDLQKVSKSCHELLVNRNSYFLVAEIGDKVVGFTNFIARKTILHSGLSGLIDELVVAKNYRGKGIGNKLLSSAVEKCRKLGCCEVEVSTEKRNTKARKFYKGCGFKEHILFEMDLKVTQKQEDTLE